MKRNKDASVILPPKTIGIIGGGQLGRMMAIAARQMGYMIAVLDPTPNCPTAQVADEHIVAAYDDMDAIKQLTEISDVVTYEFENVDVTAATYIENKGKLPQSVYALEITQNREKEKQLIDRLQLPVAPFKIVKNGEQCKVALEEMDFPLVIKTCRGGYDGKGQLKITEAKNKEAAIQFAEKHKNCIIEQWIPFDKEISVIFTRGLSGELTVFPLAENEHEDHILYKTTVPALVSDHVEKQAIEAAKTVAEVMNVVGTFAIEIFVKNDEIYLNEMAPRPHNSGHYTIEACNISQFAQHIRAICGFNLTEIKTVQETTMINILGEDLDYVLERMPTDTGAFIHLYGKAEAKEKRKMGHITFAAETKGKLDKLVRKYEQSR